MAAPSYLAGLYSNDALVRKFVARRLVGHLKRGDAEIVREIFEEEQLPDVFKWLAMALARAKDVQSLDSIRNKQSTTHDSNARDWMLASEAVLRPAEAGREALRLLRSSDESVWRDGTVWAWGSPQISDSLREVLLNKAQDSDLFEVRRWAALGLYQHGILLPSGILIENVSTADYLLQEWSLHILTSRPEKHLDEFVHPILSNAPYEHPRVVEWAIHAFSRWVGAESDEQLINVYLQTDDQGIRLACLGEIARHLSQPGIELLIDVLRDEHSLVQSLTIISSLDARFKDSPVAFRNAVSENIETLRHSGLLDALPKSAFLDASLSVSRRAAIQELLKDPNARAAIQLMLNEASSKSPGGGILEESPLFGGILIALPEEFDYFRAAVGGGLSPESGNATREQYYVKGIEAEGTDPIILVIRLVGRKGIEHAAIASTQMVTDYPLDFLVNLGISGGFSDDVDLGDVVIGDSVTNYMANSRIEDNNEVGAFEFQLAGDPYRTDKGLSDRAAALRFASEARFEEWRNEIDSHAVALGISLARPVMSMRGDLAVGPSVVASNAFKTWLLKHRRDYVAIDMESSGVASAAWSDTIRRVRLLVIRGISDMADPRKKELERENKSAFRNLAMSSATLYFVKSLPEIASIFRPKV